MSIDVGHAHNSPLGPPSGTSRTATAVRTMRRHPQRAKKPLPGLLSRRLSVQATVPSIELALLDLCDLRDYRGQLEAEEDRVSYWRRLVHGRIDLLEADARSAGGLSLPDLVRVLGDTGTGRARRALIRLRPAEPWPELPVLAEMWTSEINPLDRGAISEALRKLKLAEIQLSTYRRALHERIDESTRELILRYRHDPTEALLLLPRI
jgi:hypothetical protein